MRIAMLLGAMALALPAAQAGAAPAGQTAAKAATCTITSTGGNYSGPCQFSSDDTGSFLLTLASGKPLFGEVQNIGVYIQSPGQAVVTVQTTGNLTQQWGAATRSTAQPACWEGQGFKICAQ